MLFPDDAEWSCDCDGKTDPCAHVVAAVLSATREAAGPEAESTARPAARLGYRLNRKGRLLALTRVVLHEDGREVKLGATLTSLLTGSAAVPGLSPTHDDVAIERALGLPAREIIPVDSLPEILERLSGSVDVTLDGAPVRTSGERVVPVAVVEDGAGGDFVVRVRADPKVTEIVALGVARVGGALHPLGGMEMGEAWERLPVTRVFKEAARAELVTRVLPDLEKAFTVDIRTRKLPRKAREARPRIALDLSHQGHTLSVLPTLVYGDPPIARVDGDHVTLLGKQAPVRKLAEERELVAELRDALNLVPGRRVDFDGTSAARFAQKLRAWQAASGVADDGTSPFDAALVPRVLVDGDTFDVVVRGGGRRPAGAEAGGGDCRAARVPRRARPGPARGGRLGAVADRLAQEARAPRRRPARRARRAEEAPPRRHPRAGGALQGPRSPQAGLVRQARAAARGLRGHPPRPPPRGAPRRATPLPADRRRLARAASRRRARRHPRGRHGARQDAADARRALAGARSSSAPRASSTTGRTRSRASGRTCGWPSTTASGASSIRTPT